MGTGGGGVEFVGVLDLSAEKCVDAGGLLVGDDELELVEVRGALPVGVVAAEDGGAAGGEGDEPEGAGADRLLVEVGAGGVLGDDVRAERGQDVGEFGRRALEDELDGPLAGGAAGVEVDGFQGRLGAERLLRGRRCGGSCRGRRRR